MLTEEKVQTEKKIKKIKRQIKNGKIKIMINKNPKIKIKKIENKITRNTWTVINYAGVRRLKSLMGGSSAQERKRNQAFEVIIYFLLLLFITNIRSPQP